MYSSLWLKEKEEVVVSGDVGKCVEEEEEEEEEEIEEVVVAAL